MFSLGQHEIWNQNRVSVQQEVEMKLNNRNWISFFWLSILLVSGLFSKEKVKEFNTDNWDLQYGTVVKHMGRNALIGSATLKNVQLKNGIIEVDIAINGSRSYPGVFFRKTSKDNYERFYIRPHRAGLYPDALQYMPVVKGSETWQLYHGKGYTAGASLPINRWVRFRIEIKGDQARIFIADSKTAALVINDLKHDEAAGQIGLIGPRNGTAFFSNFSYRERDDLVFDKVETGKTDKNILRSWDLSRPIPADKYDISKLNYPQFMTIFYANWKSIHSDRKGLVNVSDYHAKQRGKKALVLARYIFQSDKKDVVKLQFGYSDELLILFNTRRIFYGNNSYQFRDPSYVGVVGYQDSVYLTVEKGLNEIMFVVKDLRGGWGFMARSDRELKAPKHLENSVSRVWESGQVFVTPESVKYDPKRDILYVSNYDIRGTDFRNTDISKYTGFISKVKLDGSIEKLKWVTNLKAPTGIGIYKKHLYVTERGALVKIEIKNGKVVKRYPIPNSEFLNGLAISKNGDVYMTDTSGSTPLKGRIFRFSKGKVSLWMENFDLNKPNCAYIEDNILYIGNSFDCGFKKIDLKTRKIDTIARLGAGVIDGIRIDKQGNHIVSHWRGDLYRIDKKGDVIRILQTGKLFQNMAGFEYIKSKNLLIIPTFMGNRVVAYKLNY